MADSNFKHSNNGKDQSLAEQAASFFKEYILVLQQTKARNGRGKENSWRRGEQEESMEGSRQKILLIQCYTLENQRKSKMKKGKIKAILKCEAISSHSSALEGFPR